MSFQLPFDALFVFSLAALLWLPGVVLSRLGRWRQDVFSQVLISVSLLSSAGLLLAQLERFSLDRLVAIVAVGAVAIGIGVRLIAQRRADRLPWRQTCLCALIACAAVITYLPPFQTFVAGSDSTMYLSAGVHLAKTGSLKVQDRISGQLGVFQRNRNFPSVGFLRRGPPFIRLAGGLLKQKRDDTEAMPAFFPLAPVWIGLLTSLDRLRAGPLVAPLFESLTVWAVCLFAAEVFGPFVAGATGIFLLTNFAVWWYGRFVLSEPLAAYFLWAAFVMLARWHKGDRGSLALAGAALGLAGFARTEIIPFTVAAAMGVLAWKGLPGRPGWGLGVLAWLPLTVCALLQVLFHPSHHQAYFSSDLAFAKLHLARLLPPPYSRWVPMAFVSLIGLSGLLSWQKGGKVAFYWFRAVVLLGGSASLALYLLLGGDISVSRSAVWLMRYLGLGLLGLSLLGFALVPKWGASLPPFAVTMWLVASVTFLLNPHVALTHPWAIRRFLPEIIPGLVLLAALALGSVAGFRNRSRTRLAVACVIALAAASFQARPIMGLWSKPLYREVLNPMAELNRQLEPGSAVVVESLLADWQLQVPLWLVYGHETVMAQFPSPNWRRILYSLTKPNAPQSVYWLTFGREGYVAPPRVFGLRFKQVSEIPIAVGLPRQATDRPPSQGMLLRTYLKLFRVKRGPGNFRPKARG